ncbi:MAG: M28 family peptidase [Planctomycetota bacterium]|nr:M28 family peptidase [Planctomycetota bacterium]
MKSVLVWLFVAAIFLGLFGAYSTFFPGTNAPAKGAAADSGDVMSRLKDHVEYLAQSVGSRDKPGPIQDAGDYLERQLRRAGQDVKAIDGGSAAGGSKTLVAEVTGTKYAREVVILAAHYDGPRASPAADAGASGAAVLVEVARQLAGSSHERTLRFVLFPDGSKRDGDPDSAAANYAKECKSRGETIAAVVYLDSVGLFEDKDTQTYPFPLMLAFPSRADFLAVVGGYQCRDLTSKTTELMRTGTGLSIQGLVVPEFAPGTGFSPHAAFWNAGFPAVVVTDTGEWRSKRFGSPSDTHDRLDYERMTRVVLGLARTVGLLVKKSTLAA